MSLKKAALPARAVPPTGSERDDEQILNLSLRPKRLGEFVGQTRLIENLRVAIQAAQRRQDPLEHLLFAGPPGLGKTTIAHLCLRFWDPDAGEIRLGGYGLRAWRLDDLRREIALVAQDTYLFNDTLRANVLLADPTATEAELSTALARASLGDLIESARTESKQHAWPDNSMKP